MGQGCGSGRPAGLANNDGVIPGLLGHMAGSTVDIRRLCSLEVGRAAEMVTISTGHGSIHVEKIPEGVPFFAVHLFFR